MIREVDCGGVVIVLDCFLLFYEYRELILLLLLYDYRCFITVLLCMIVGE